MIFFKNLFKQKSVATFNEKKVALLAELQRIEEKYLAYFQEKALETVSLLPESLQHHYRLRREFEYVRFDYEPGSTLPAHIRRECDAAYQKVWGNN